MAAFQRQGLAYLPDRERVLNRTFAWLAKAYEERSDLLIYLKLDPRWDNLRSDPRFADLVRRIGIS